jgi:uncharacterized protein YjbI with pentapeptide repeats
MKNEGNQKQPMRTHKKIRGYIEERNGILGREDVLKLIKMNGGTHNLDLSGCNLSGINLIGEDLQGIILGSTATVKYEDIGVVERITNLEGAWFERADLTNANFGRANLKGAHFYKAKLVEATLWTANAEQADFRDADLSKADLFSTILRSASLIGAHLEKANLHKADLRDTAFTIESIGARIIQEDINEFREYYNRWYISPTVRNRHMTEQEGFRFKDAKEIYLALKNAFLSAGRYDDASKAYFKERQLEKITLAPWRAVDYYGASKHRGFKIGSISWWGFRLHYTLKWVANWVAELSCGYGEKPLRSLLWAFFSIVLFSLTYYLSGGIAITGENMTWLDYFIYSLGAFSTIGFDKFQASTPLSQILTSLEALSGISLLAILMFTLGNRISRS